MTDTPDAATAIADALAKAMIPVGCFVYAEPEVNYGPDIHAPGDGVHPGSHAPIGLERPTVLQAICDVLNRAPELLAENAALKAEVARLRNILDTERYKVAIGVQSVARAVQGRQWLCEPGRGCYTYDDERYQEEFGAALIEIDAALAPLRAIARDWSDCPTDPLDVAANRRAALEARHD